MWRRAPRSARVVGHRLETAARAAAAAASTRAGAASGGNARAGLDPGWELVEAAVNATVLTTNRPAPERRAPAPLQPAPLPRPARGPRRPGRPAARSTRRSSPAHRRVGWGVVAQPPTVPAPMRHPSNPAQLDAPEPPGSVAQCPSRWRWAIDNRPGSGRRAQSTPFVGRPRPGLGGWGSGPSTLDRWAIDQPGWGRAAGAQSTQPVPGDAPSLAWIVGQWSKHVGPVGHRPNRAGVGPAGAQS